MTLKTSPTKQVNAGPGPARERSQLKIRWWPAVSILACLSPLILAAQDRSPPTRRPSRSRPAMAPTDRDTRGSDSVSADQDSPRKAQPSLTLLDLINYAQPSREALDEVQDYTALFTKTEMIKGRKINQVM